MSQPEGAHDALPDEIVLTAEDLARINAELIRLRAELAARRATEKLRAQVIALCRSALKGEKSYKETLKKIIEICQNGGNHE